MRDDSALQSLTRRTYALVLAGGRGARLHQLTDWRAKPAVPFAGKLPIIDVARSNCVNSGIRRVGVLTQYKAQSLIRHIERGWGFLDMNLGEYIDVVPAQQRVDEQWYSGTANAVFQNLDILREAEADHVLVLAGDHVYKMDYARMLADHVERGAELSIACIEVPLERARDFGVLQIDAQRRVLAFCEKPDCPEALPGDAGHALASMGIYVFDTAVLIDELLRDARDAASAHDFGRDLVPAMLERRRVFAHRFEESCVSRSGRPYWRDVGTVDAYWAANIDLTQVVPELDLYDDRWPILSLQRQLPPAKFVFDEAGRRGMALDSLVSSGCIVSGGTVRRSVLFSKVLVGEGSLVEDAVVLPAATIGRDCVVRRAVIDKRCAIPDGLCIGVDLEVDRQRFHVTERGVVLVTPEMLGQSVQTVY